jgi:hypothetical protein
MDNGEFEDETEETGGESEHAERARLKAAFTNAIGNAATVLGRFAFR